MQRCKQSKANAHFRRGAYTDVRDPRKAQFNATMRRIYAFRLIFASPGNPTLGQIIRAHFKFYVVAFYNSDIVHSQLTGNIGGYNVAVGQLYFEVCVGQALYYFAFRFDNVVF